MKTYTTITIFRNEAEIDIEVSYTPGARATHLDPEEYPEVEIISATIDGEETELTEAEEDAVKQEILSNPAERDFD